MSPSLSLCWMFWHSQILCRKDWFRYCTASYMRRMRHMDVYRFDYDRPWQIHWRRRKGSKTVMMTFHLKCLLKMITGFDCPFCGAQRAFDALLHGDIFSVWHCNPFLVIISPYLVIVGLNLLKVIPSDCRLMRFLYNRWVILALGVITVGWWIFRNTEMYRSLWA